MEIFSFDVTHKDGGGLIATCHQYGIQVGRDCLLELFREIPHAIGWHIAQNVLSDRVPFIDSVEIPIDPDREVVEQLVFQVEWNNSKVSITYKIPVCFQHISIDVLVK